MKHLSKALFTFAKTARLAASLAIFGSLSVGCAADSGEDAANLAQTSQPAYVLTTSAWTSPSIAVCWEQAGSDTEKKWVRDAVRVWENASNVRLNGWTTCTSTSRGIRIAIADVRPFTSGLGRYIDGVPNGMTLNFTFANFSTSACATNRQMCIQRIAVHEFGHALGLAHEQNRDDTPNSCMPCSKNSDCTDNVCKLYPGKTYGHCTQGSDGDKTIGSWDPNSVMNYCNPTWNNGGVLSVTDAQAVRYLYGPNTITITSTDSREMTNLCLGINFKIDGQPHYDYECISKLDGTYNLGLNANGGTLRSGTWTGNFLYLTSAIPGGPKKLSINLADTRAVTDVVVHTSFKIGTDWHSDYEAVGALKGDLQLVLNAWNGTPGTVEVVNGTYPMPTGWVGNFLHL